MIKRLWNWLFGGGYKRKYLDLLQDYKTSLQNTNTVKSVYTFLKEFDLSDQEVIRKLASVHDMDEMKFFLFDMKQKYIEMMIEGDIGGNLQVEKAFYVLKGISMVERNLSEFKRQFESIVKQENQNA